MGVTFKFNLVLAVLSLTGAQAARAQDSVRDAGSKARGEYTSFSTKVGDTVVVVKDTPKREQNRTIGNVTMGQRFNVQAVEADWLWPDQGKPGWISRHDVLPVDQAASHFTRLISQTPTDPRAYQARGSVWIAKQDWDRAIADLDRAVQLAPENDFNYRERGLAWQKKGNYNRATDDFNEAIRLNPQSAIYRMNRGAALENKGDFARARGDFDAAVRLEPEHPGPYNNRAYLMATCPDAQWRSGTQAVADATMACRMSSWANFTYLGTLAAAHAESGDFAAAVRWQTRALELAPVARRPQWQARLDLYRAGKPYREQGPW